MQIGLKKCCMHRCSQNSFFLSSSHAKLMFSEGMKKALGKKDFVGKRSEFMGAGLCTVRMWSDLCHIVAMAVLNSPLAQ